jgi:hypothetical protein
MLFASSLQIMRVKRLINYNRVIPISPSSHHRSGNVARPGPHGDADVHGVNSQAAKPRTQRVEDNAFLRCSGWIGFP